MGFRIGGLIRGRRKVPAGKGRPRRFLRPTWEDLITSGVAVAALSLLAGFISLPLVSLVIWTVSNASWRSMASPVAVDALLLSAKTTAVTMAIVIVIGTPAAYALARFEFSGKRVVDTLIDIPAVLPPSAAGIALLLTFGRFGILGEHLQAFGVTITFTTAAVILAQVFVASHFYVRQAAVGFGRVNREVEEAAQVDGAGRAEVFLKITIPLTFPALVAGAVTAWARALGEFGATLIIAGNLQGVTQTMPLAIYAALENDFDAAVALSVMVLCFAFAVILTARYLTRRAAEIEG